MKFYKFLPLLILEKKLQWSHWGELNPRPSPYQGDAIPLSHSGSERATDRTDLTTAGWGRRFETHQCCKEILRQTKVKVVSRRIQAEVA